MPQNACLCGCGAVTDKSFVSGHDQRAAWRLLIDLYGSAANAVKELTKLRDALSSRQPLPVEEILLSWHGQKASDNPPVTWTKLRDATLPTPDSLFTGARGLTYWRDLG